MDAVIWSQKGRVAVQVEKSPQALALYLACLRVGACFLPLNTAYKTAELTYLLSNSELALFICRPDDFEELKPKCDG